MSGPNGKENNSPEKVGQREKGVAPTMTGVSGNSQVPLQSSSEKGGETGSQMQTESSLISQQTVRKVIANCQEACALRRLCVIAKELTES